MLLLSTFSADQIAIVHIVYWSSSYCSWHHLAKLLLSLVSADQVTMVHTICWPSCYGLHCLLTKLLQSTRSADQVAIFYITCRPSFVLSTLFSDQVTLVHIILWSSSYCPHHPLTKFLLSSSSSRVALPHTIFLPNHSNPSSSYASLSLPIKFLSTTYNQRPPHKGFSVDEKEPSRNSSHFRLTKIFSSSSLVMRRWGLVGLSVGLP